MAIELPVCRWRGDFSEETGNFKCSSERMNAPTVGFPPVVCRGCANCDHEPQPGLLGKMINLAKATALHAADGFAKVDNAEYNERLRSCSECPSRSEDWKCLECGCYLSIKAGWRSESCPLGKWQRSDEHQNIEQKNTVKPCGCGQKPV